MHGNRKRTTNTQADFRAWAHLYDASVEVYQTPIPLFIIMMSPVWPFIGILSFLKYVFFGHRIGLLFCSWKHLRINNPPTDFSGKAYQIHMLDRGLVLLEVSGRRRKRRARELDIKSVGLFVYLLWVRIDSVRIHKCTKTSTMSLVISGNWHKDKASGHVGNYNKQSQTIVVNLLEFFLARLQTNAPPNRIHLWIKRRRGKQK